MFSFISDFKLSMNKVNIFLIKTEGLLFIKSPIGNVYYNIKLENELESIAGTFKSSRKYSEFVV